MSDPATPYDPACAALATAILAADAPPGRNGERDPAFAARVASLAVEIQRAIEGWYDAHAEAESWEEGEEERGEGS